ncbi:molybdopterin-guanine dinucleotide biosynthesis protein MobA, partial [Enterobacter hormaechei]|nr:molybdopterin-guanine dinucleotide biosynthesis protein MobA [Enterobacter hormaechei]
GKKPSVSISDSGTNTILITSISQNPNRASRSAPKRLKRKQATPRQENVFKRFTALLVDFIRDKFIWAKANKSQIDLISEEHDKRIAENYVFDEVLGRHVSRNEYEQRAKFNNDEKQKQTEICATKPAAGEIYRFPSRVKKSEQPSNTPDYIPTLSSGKRNGTKLRPPAFPPK